MLSALQSFRHADIRIWTCPSTLLANLSSWQARFSGSDIERQKTNGVFDQESDFETSFQVSFDLQKRFFDD